MKYLNIFLLCISSIAHSSEFTTGGGLGQHYSGLGYNFLLHHNDWYLGPSIGCFSFSTDDSEIECGGGFNFGKSYKKHAVGTYIGVIGTESYYNPDLSFEYDKIYGVGVNITYFSGEKALSGLVVGVGAVSDFSGENKITVEIGYNFTL